MIPGHGRHAHGSQRSMTTTDGQLPREICSGIGLHLILRDRFKNEATVIHRGARRATKPFFFERGRVIALAPLDLSLSLFSGI